MVANSVIPKSNFENILLVFWLFAILTINLNIYSLYNIDSEDILSSKNIILLTNYIRYFAPLLLLPILIYKNFTIKKDIFTNLYLFYCIWQLSVYVLLNKKIENFDNFLIIINLIFVLLIFNLANFYNYKYFLYKSLFIIVLFISIIFCFFTFRLLVEFYLKPEMIYLYSSITLEAEKLTFFQNNIRITGLSRMCVILLFFTFYLQNKYKTNQKIKYIFFLSLFFFSCMIFAMQTRGGLIGVGVLLSIYFFFIKDVLKNKIFIFLIIIVLPIFFWEIIKTYKINYLEKNFNSEKNFNTDKTFDTDKIEDLSKDEIKVIYNNRYFNPIKVGANDDITSGRLIIWKRSFELIFEEKIILGLGPQADRRFLIEQNFKDDPSIYFWQNNSSNALIYSYLCGGILGLFFLICIYGIVIVQILKTLFIKKSFNNCNSITKFSVTTLIFLIIRSMFENSFAHFSIDFCLFSLCYFILRKYNVSKKTSN
jgi:hypothetical protein